MSLTDSDYKANIEALLFVSGEPLGVGKLADILALPVDRVEELLAELTNEMNSQRRGIMLTRAAGGYQLCTRPEFSASIEQLAKVTENKLSMPALETLSIIAFRQPITKQEIEEIRGVKIDRVLNRLSDFGLIKEIGRKAVIGRPILYATTDEFLKCFGLDALTDLPSLPEADKFFDEVNKQVEEKFKQSPLIDNN